MFERLLGRGKIQNFLLLLDCLERNIGTHKSNLEDHIHVNIRREVYASIRVHENITAAEVTILKWILDGGKVKLLTGLYVLNVGFFCTGYLQTIYIS